MTRTTWELPFFFRKEKGYRTQKETNIDMEKEKIDKNYMGDGIYRENILDHYKNPRNKGNLENPDIQHRELNPLCGDQIEITMKLDGQKIADIKFAGHGCAISQSSASMLTEKVKNLSLDDAMKISKDEIVEMMSIPISPVRLKCAILSLDTLKNAIHIFEKYKKGSN